MDSKNKITIIVILFVILSLASPILISTSNAQTWPTSWTWIDSDHDEDGTADDYRDVQYAYISMDNEYFYFRGYCTHKKQ